MNEVKEKAEDGFEKREGSADPRQEDFSQHRVLEEAPLALREQDPCPAAQPTRPELRCGTSSQNRLHPRTCTPKPAHAWCSPCGVRGPEG